MNETHLPCFTQSVMINDEIIEKKRHLTFSNIVSVYLYISRDELKIYDLHWKYYEYEFFKNDAYREIKIHSTRHNVSFKQAIFQMYQPDTN